MSETKTKSNKEEIDPEMLKNLDILMDLDLLQTEDDWSQIEDTDSQEVENE